MDTLKDHLTKIGKKKSAAKTLAAQKNGLLGGRPRKSIDSNGLKKS